MKKLLVVLFCFTLYTCGSPVYSSEDVSILAGQWSHHQTQNADFDYNESHDLIGVRVGDYSIFRYNNSKFKESYALLKDIHMSYLGNGFTAGISAGIVTNYSQDGLPTINALLTLRKQIGSLGIEFNTVPNFVYTVGFSYKTDYKVKTKETFESNWALSYGYGYGGANAAVTYNLNDYFNLRAFGTSKTMNWYDYWNDEVSAEVTLIQHEVLKARTFGLVVDYAPFKGNFQLFGGIGHNASYYKTKFTVHPVTNHSGNVRLNHKNVRVSSGDTVDGYATANKFSGVAGVRWGNPFTENKAWSWWLEASVVTLNGLEAEAVYTTAEYSEADIELLQGALEVWEGYEEDKYEAKYKVIPNLSVGVTFRF